MAKLSVTSKAVSGHKYLIGNYMAEIIEENKDEKETSSPETTVVVEETKPTEEEVRNAQLLKDNAELEAAKVAATSELQRIRAEKREVKKAVVQESKAEDEEPVIDMTDPSAKAWDKHIKESVSPALADIELGKAEVREFALQEFLANRPALKKNPEKLKELMGMYERIHTATERTPEGVLLDLDKAYAVVYHKELLEAAQEQKVGIARRDAIFSDPGVSRGATTYTTPKEKPVQLSAEENAILAKWGMSPQEWQKMRNEQIKKEQEAV